MTAAREAAAVVTAAREAAAAARRGAGLGRDGAGESSSVAMYAMKYVRVATLPQRWAASSAFSHGGRYAAESRPAAAVARASARSTEALSPLVVLARVRLAPPRSTSILAASGRSSRAARWSGVPSGRGGRADAPAPAATAPSPAS